MSVAVMLYFQIINSRTRRHDDVNRRRGNCRCSRNDSKIQCDRPNMRIDFKMPNLAPQSLNSLNFTRARAIEKLKNDDLTPCGLA